VKGEPTRIAAVWFTELAQKLRRDALVGFTAGEDWIRYEGDRARCARGLDQIRRTNTAIADCALHAAGAAGRDVARAQWRDTRAWGFAQDIRR